MSDSEINLSNTFDATHWAAEFMRIFKDRTNEIDEALITTWFAAALMKGYDTGRGRTSPNDLDYFGYLKTEKDNTHE